MQSIVKASIISLVAGLSLAAAANGLGCGERPTRESAAQGSSTAPERSAPGARPEVLVDAYPPQRWRLAGTEELGKTMLWVSQILIRHDGVEPGIISFQLADWRPGPAVPARTRKEAFELARRIRDEAAQNSADFAAIARRVSEDVATRDNGGSLGGTCALELQTWPKVLDALASIRPGEVSRVVETEYGFHIFTRQAPPAAQVVSGSRIVLAYDEAPWLGAFLARRKVQPRLRAEALALGQNLYERARSGEDFDRLVEEYTDHREAVRHGDFGAWSTHERTPYPREVEALQRLAIGEVAAPLDTAFGVQIIQRTADRPRKTYAMASVQQQFDFNSASGTASSRRQVGSNVELLAQTLQREPARFAELQQQYCCTGVEQWQEGRGEANVERALDALHVGGISTAVEISSAYAVVKRLDPSPVDTPSVTFELPAPAAPDIDDLVQHMGINEHFPAIAKLAQARLQLAGKVAEEFMALHEREGATPTKQFEPERVARFSEFGASVRGALGDERYAAYRRVMDEYFEHDLLSTKLDIDNQKQTVQTLPRPE